ncbi:MAG: thiamine pyrophosphate-dependent enzyme, partial [Acidobacteria bacterium]|nr:thiamine pyrophosphate-dependent enzyme [Acidobacteriota bacterium]
MEALGSAADPNSGGRQMPSHWGHPRLNVVSKSSCTGTQYLQAVGCSQAGRYIGAVKECRERQLQHQNDEITYVSGGEGSTSEGEFWEALNSACNLKLPMLFLIQDNKYAISVPVEVQTAGGTIKALVKDWPNLRYEELDGCDPLECYRVLSDVVADMRRRREGPALIQAHVVRPYSHSLSDDERSYKPEKERQEEAKQDPITCFEKFLQEEGIADEAFLARMREGIEQEVNEATDQAKSEPLPSPDTIYDHVYSSQVDPTSEAFSTPAKPEGDPKTMVDLLNACLRDEMARDPRIVIFGEDVADASRDQYLGEVKGKGGVFKVTHNLQRAYGRDRVFNSPLAEANIVGRAIGMATRGLKPVVEIQFLDYIWPAFMQIRNELSILRWRSNNGFACPVVIRVAS